MAKYKFDGKYLKQGGTTIANVSGDRIRKGTGSSSGSLALLFQQKSIQHQPVIW